MWVVIRIADNRIIDNKEIIDVGMVEVRYLKLINTHYGGDSQAGQNILKNQKECFQHEHNGT